MILFPGADTNDTTVLYFDTVFMRFNTSVILKVEVNTSCDLVILLTVLSSTSDWQNIRTNTVSCYSTS